VGWEAEGESVVFKSRTVFVIGAGASQEVKFPVGQELANELGIRLKLQIDWGEVRKGDREIGAALQRLVADEPRWKQNNFIGSARELSEAMEMAVSIDNFLEAHADDEELVLLGKLGIASVIIDKERHCPLAPRNEGREAFSLQLVAATWLVSLGQLLTLGVPVGRAEHVLDNVSFITFNYDRSLEVFLARALAVYYRMRPEEAAALVENAAILHPYGSLGAISGASPRLAFAPREGKYDLYEVSQRIRTFSENVDDQKFLSAVRTKIQDAEQVVFLGFGYHDQNMELITPTIAKADRTPRLRRVLATTCGLSKSDTEIVRGNIGRMMKNRPLGRNEEYTIETFDGECRKFFGEYWRTLIA